MDAGQPLAGPLFSICTLVTRPAEYTAMVESFQACGFTPDKAEFLYLDNTKGHQWDAFQGIRRFLSLARGAYVLRISDPHGEDQRRGKLPARVVSLDENFIIIRRDALVSISAGLSGLHLYGTDLCLQARCAGRSAWVIDFHLRHLSAGKVDASFHQAQQRLEAHYDTLLSLPWQIRTTCTKLILGGGGPRRWLARRKLARRLQGTQ